MCSFDINIKLFIFIHTRFTIMSELPLENFQFKYEFLKEGIFSADLT